MSKQETERKKYFYSYPSAVRELGISRRTLRRWLDYTNVEPLEFEDQAKVFLTRPHIERLLEYGKVLSTGDRDLLAKFKHAYENEDERMLERLRKVLTQSLAQKVKKKRG